MPKKCTHLNKDLPVGFEPGPYAVICGKGSENFNSCGNRRFRLLVRMRRERYAECKVRADKSRLVSEVIDITRSAGGDFVKWDEKRCQWFIISEPLVREKVGAAFRDCLTFKYSSATKNKNARRLAREKLEREQRKRRSSSIATTTTEQQQDQTAINQPSIEGKIAPAPVAVSASADALVHTSTGAAPQHPSIFKPNQLCGGPPPASPATRPSSMVFESVEDRLGDLLVEDFHEIDVHEALSAVISREHAGI